jgi:predicted RNA-binding Zn ribbon-like protein
MTKNAAIGDGVRDPGTDEAGGIRAADGRRASDAAGATVRSRLADGPAFELTGGELCLDFSNTLNARPTGHPEELLTDFNHLVEWSLQAGAIGKEGGAALRALAARQPREASAVLTRAHALREAIFAIFSASVRQAPPPAGALDLLNRDLPATMGHLRLKDDGTTFRWEWEDQHALDRMLWPVLRSAADLLTSESLTRVRQCAAEDCDWLFLDQSRNRSRRWCDMSVCGNRSKVRRFRKAMREV